MIPLAPLEASLFFNYSARASMVLAPPPDFAPPPEVIPPTLLEEVAGLD